MIIGASVILRYEGRLLFEIQKPAKWRQQPDGTLSIGMGCIGGNVEQGETPRQALEREVLEEMGCRVVLEEPTQPFAVDAQGSIRMLHPLDVPEGVLFVWQGSEPGFIEGAQVAVHVGRPLGQPEPGDLPALLSLDQETFCALGMHRLTVQDVLERGGRLWEKQPVP